MKKIRKKLLMFFISFCIFSSYFVLGYTENIFSLNNKVYAATVSKVVNVSSVSLNKVKNTLTLGGKDTLTATVLPSNAANKGVTWSTSDSKVATVSNGMVTAVGQGTAAITVTTVDGKKTAKYIVNVNSLINVNSVSLNKTKNTLTVGGKDTLTATVLPNNAANKDISWSTSNNKVATVSNGVVTAVGKGTATITVTTSDGRKTASYIVTVNSVVQAVQPVKVTSIVLNKTVDNLTLGEWGNLYAYEFLSQTNAPYQPVTWSTSNSKVATVSPKGEVSTVGAGTAVISATAGDKTAKCTVIVKNPVIVQSITINKTSETLAEGACDNLYTSILPFEAKGGVIWSTSNSKIVDVDTNGKITAVSVGKAIIKAAAQDGSKSAICIVTVIPAVKVRSVALNINTSTLTVGSSNYLYATISPSAAVNKDVTWSTSNSKVAIVDSVGNVTAIGVGKATITAATVDGGKSSSCIVTVNAAANNKVTSITLNKTKDSLAAGTTDYLNVSLSPYNTAYQAIGWTTSNPKVALVNSSGVITAVAPGTATITATLDDGSKSASCLVTVTPAVKVTSIVLNKTTSTLNVGGYDWLSAKVTPNTATNQSVIWTTSNSNVLTVSYNGYIYALGTGTATITAITVDGSKTATCVVTVNPPIKVEGVQFDIPPSTLTVGNTTSIHASVYPYNAANTSLTWGTSNSKVATVDNYGYITAISAGTVNITATTVDGNKMATCTITVNTPVKVTGIGLYTNSAALTVGNSTYLYSIVYPTNASNQSITWSTSNSKVATVNSSGTVTAVGAGTATITATTVDGSKTATCTIIVTPPVAVTSVTINRTTDTLTTGGTDSLWTIVYPYNAANKNVTWTTSNPKVAIVSSSGYVTGVSAGTATITATTVDGSKTATCTITVTPPVKVTGIGLYTTSTTLTVGNNTWLSYTIYPYNAANQSVIWTTSNSKVATVSTGGIVTAVSVGTAAITATTEDGNKKATCIVTVTPLVAVTSVAMNRTTDTLTVGGTDSLWATVYPYNAANQNVIWSTSDSKVVTVSSNGYITAIGAGTATVTATTADGSKTATCKVTVTAPIGVTSVALSKTTSNLAIGDTDYISATVSPRNAVNQAVIWTSSDSNVVVVTSSYSSSVNIKAVSAGTATITATTVDGSKIATCKVTVTAPVAVTSVGLNKTKNTLTVGTTYDLDATIYPYNAANKNVAWTSSDYSVASVDSNGNVTAIAVGTAVVTATTDDGSKTADCTITVIPPISVTSIGLDKASVTLTEGGSTYVYPKIYPSNAANQSVIWTTSDSTVASVSTSSWSTYGYITAVGAGTATITATTEDGKKVATCKVTVNPVIKVTSVSLNETTSSLKVGGTDYLYATVSPNDAADNTVIWTTSDSDVATVNYYGNVTAVGVGAATITATTVDGSKTATCVVTVSN